MGCLKLAYRSEAEILIHRDSQNENTVLRCGCNAVKQSKNRVRWYDYGARFYDPQIGRWNVVDPMAGEKLWETPYHYCSNNPWNMIDVSGMYDGWYLTYGNEMKYDPLVTSQQYMIDNEIDGIFMGMDNVEAHLTNGDGFIGYANGDYGISLPDISVSANAYKYDPSATFAFCDMFEKTLFNTTATVASLPFTELSLAASSFSSAAADFGIQMSANEFNIGEWNISSTIGNAFLKNPFSQSAFGSAFNIRPNNIIQGNYLNNSLLGQKSFSTFAFETGVGGVFNYTGREGVKGLGFDSFPARIAAETPALFLNNSISLSIMNYINYQRNK
jgi:RHS repeat-associated protein